MIVLGSPVMLMFVCVLGIIVGLLHRRRAEKPITIMLASLGILLLISVADVAKEEVLYRLFASARGGGGIIDTLDRLWYLLASFVKAAATGGLIFAALYDRGFDLLNFSAPVKE